MSAPKLFISYSWSDHAHEQWVVNLAIELRDSGVDVILDKWDLKEGHDAIAFMEQMVNNADIKKVALICDKTYAAKADGRAGGVGTETQIISKEVYDNQAQEKFVAVVTQKDENGKPFLPTYYKSRIYIDLSESDRYAQNYEQLLRWIFDKPLYVKPDLGNRPSFLSEEPHVSLGTTALFKRCTDAIKNNKTHASGAMGEYCDLFAQNLERFRLSNSQGEFDDAVVKSIEEFLPYRNEVIQLFTVVAQYSTTRELTERIHRLFENLLPYIDRPASASSWTDWDFDNFRFIIHELFLYGLGILLKYDRLDQANILLEQMYYIPGNSDYGRDVMVPFTSFRASLSSLERRNQRLNLRRLSLHADMLKERCKGTAIDFRYLMQADFIAFMRSELKEEWGPWWPETLLYLGEYNSPFEIFARSVSKAYFDRAKILLAINTPVDLEPLLKSYQERSRRFPRWNYHSLNPAALIGYDRLASLP